MHPYRKSRYLLKVIVYCVCIAEYMLSSVENRCRYFSFEMLCKLYKLSSNVYREWNQRFKVNVRRRGICFGIFQNIHEELKK